MLMCYYTVSLSHSGTAPTVWEEKGRRPPFTKHHSSL